MKTPLVAIVGTMLVIPLLTGCQDRPARIVDPTPASRAALHSAVAVALNGADVMLADDALTQSSVLTIERKAFRDTENNRIMGRELGMPIQFRLIKHGEQCYLVRESSGAKWLLADTTCVAE